MIEGINVATRAAELAEQWRNGNHASVIVELATGPRSLALAFGLMVAAAGGYNHEAGAQLLGFVSDAEVMVQRGGR